MFDIESIREDFPILSKIIGGKQITYLDNGATTQKPRRVIERIVSGYSTRNANIHRGVHQLSREATEAHEEARKTVQRFINAKSSGEIIFTRGTTESINLVASSFAERYIRHGDEVLISAMEHHSNIVPWQRQAASLGATIRVIPLDKNGEISFETFKRMLTENTALVAISHVSNVLGTVNPIAEIIAEAHKYNIPVLVDGAQAIAHTSVDVQKLNADFYTFSSHKAYGPNGIGVLYGKKKYLEVMPPYQCGGEMIKSVSFEKTTYNDLPFKFEAGTPDYIGSTALAEAIDYMNMIGMDNIAAHEDELMKYAESRLCEIDGLKIIGNAQHKSSAISFTIENIHHYDMGMLLDQVGIAVRTGHHCAQPLMKVLGIDGTIRASFALYNTKAEIDTLVEGINMVRKML